MEDKIFIDPAFLRDSNYSYVNYKDTELNSVLCFALARNKTDLILHQQRIENCVKYNNKNILFSSIIDLFITLGNKGNQYKSRILDKYRKSLTSQQTILLTKALVKGIHKTDSIPYLDQSLFNYGQSGKLLSSTMINPLSK